VTGVWGALFGGRAADVSGVYTFKEGSRRERRAWRGGRMSKVWGGGRGGWVVVGVGIRGGAVVVVGVALDDMIFVVRMSGRSDVSNGVELVDSAQGNWPKCWSQSCVEVRADDAGRDFLRSHLRPMLPIYLHLDFLTTPLDTLNTSPRVLNRVIHATNPPS